MMEVDHIKHNHGTEIAALVLCCRVFLKTATQAQLSAFIIKNPPDWEGLYELARIHRIRPLIYETVSKIDNVDSSFKQKLKQFFISHSLRSFQTQQRATQLVSLMKNDQIQIQLYKGIHLSQSLHNHLSIREFGDVDFIVQTEDVPRLIAVLKKSGYNMEGQTIYDSSPEKYMANQKDVICYDKTPDGLFLYEFHYKLIGSYLSMNISFKDLLPDSWRLGSPILPGDYLPLLTVNHGLVDLYPGLRSIVDMAIVTQQCGNKISEYHRANQHLGGYYALNAYLVKELLNVESSSFSSQANPQLIAALGSKIVNRLLTKKEGKRVSTLTILKTSFLLRQGVTTKIKLIKAIIKYIFTPNYNDEPQTQFRYKWMQLLARPIRLLQHSKRHI